MLIVAMVMGLLLQSGSAAVKVPPTPSIPTLGLSVAPKSADILSLEKSDPVARRCAQLGEGLAAKVHGEVGDVSIQRTPDGGPVWSATLLMEKEPPIAPRMTCNARTFTIANDTFDVSTPPGEMRWPYCGWGLAKERQVGVVCGR